MPTLYIENFVNEDLFADPPTETARVAVRARSGLFLWLAAPGDVLVLSRRPSDAFLDYVTRTLGMDTGDLTVLVPPPGRLGEDMLTRDRLGDPEFVTRLARLGCTDFTAYCLDRFTTSIAAAAGVADAVPGQAFVDEGGADLFNSKSTFRALAAGLGLPTARGAVVRGLDEAVETVDGYLRRGAHVIVKRDFHGGGFGNVVLSPDPGLPAIGAGDFAHTPAGSRAPLRQRWDYLSSGGKSPVVVEEYHENCVTLCAEFAISAHEVTTDVLVEMRMRPRVDGFAWLDPGTGAGSAGRFRRLALRLAEVMRTLGYRGLVNIDGIVTPDGQVLLSEFNARLSGFTHLHRLLVRLVGPDYPHERHVAAGVFPAPSTKDAEHLLALGGLRYDHRRREGVVLTSDGAAASGRAAYCAIATSATRLAALEDAVAGLTPA
ncbi:peptide ligase PGM1-related protein [Amycolatopsis anabasis]|uniref:preATP grasp domain-containing protein n=1 Tax=Amycolatopsis anabasis TaxID=1840409 RepID=UPI00131C7CCF|nr:peptide ligase PGM1-related protein [Amycolatopsis anabasis]